MNQRPNPTQKMGRGPAWDQESSMKENLPATQERPSQAWPGLTCGHWVCKRVYLVREGYLQYMNLAKILNNKFLVIISKKKLSDSFKQSIFTPFIHSFIHKNCLKHFSCLAGSIKDHLRSNFFSRYTYSIYTYNT